MVGQVNKWLYGWKLLVNYGQGWEYETFEPTYAEMRENRKAYRENCPYPLQVVKGRVVNPEWLNNFVGPLTEQDMRAAWGNQ